jgi:tetratricopeptide (TPR) repeat protein
LQDVSKGHEELRAYIAQQKKVLAEESDPKRKEALALIGQGDLEQGRFEYDEALKAYDKALELHKDEGLARRRDQLREKWKIKSPEHQQARTWIYKTWPEADVVKEPKVLDEAKAMFEVCEKAGDPLTVQKFFKEAIEHAGKLKKQHEALETDVNDSDRKQAVVLAEVGNKLKPLIAQAQAYLQKAGGMAP